MAEQKQRRIPVWVTFSALRLASFAVPLVIIYALSDNLVVSAVFAAVLGLCFSVIFLGRQRSEAVGAMRSAAPRRAPKRRSADEDAEDLVDRPGPGAQDPNASAAARLKP